MPKPVTFGALGALLVLFAASVLDVRRRTSERQRRQDARVERLAAALDRHGPRGSF